MPTSAEVRAQLTGPGGMFEVVTEDVLGRPTEVYANRMPSLRSVAEVGLHARRRPDLHRLRRPHLRLRRPSCRPPTASPTRCASSFGLGQGRPGRRAVAEQPGVVPRLLGDGAAGRGPRRPQRVVDHRRDRVRPPGLRRQGARRRPEALRAHRRLARPVARPRARVPRSTAPPPTSAWPTTRASTRFDELTGAPTADVRRRGRSPRTTPRSSSTRPAPPAGPRAPSPPTGA